MKTLLCPQKEGKRNNEKEEKQSRTPDDTENSNRAKKKAEQIVGSPAILKIQQSREGKQDEYQRDTDDSHHQSCHGVEWSGKCAGWDGDEVPGARPTLSNF